MFLSNHELENTDTNTPPTKVIGKMIFVELLSTREETVIHYLCGINPLAYFSLLSMLKLIDYILPYGARRLLVLDGDSLIVLDAMKVVFTICFVLSR